MKEINLTKEYTDILLELSYFRALTVYQTQQLLYKNEYTLSREKRLYYVYRRLKSMKLVTTARPDDAVSKQRTHYLTKKGFDYVQNILIPTPNYKGSGWRDSLKPIYQKDIGHFDYETYLPPLKQYKHFYELTNVLINLQTECDIPSSNLRYRHNLYAAKEYGRFKLKPDAEVTCNNRTFYLEIDTGSENHNRLVQKFINYRSYLEATKNQIKENSLETSIVFLLGNDFLSLERRTNIIKVAYNHAFAGCEIKPKLRVYYGYSVFLLPYLTD